MRIGVISDTHIPARAKDIPGEILEAFKNVDMVVHAGDLEDLSVLDKLRASCPDVKAVRGNMDPAGSGGALPEKIVFKAGGFKFGVMHGYGAPNKLIEILTPVFKDDAVDVIIFGHSHAPFNEKKNGILFFNPGSATDKVFSPYNSYGIIEINDKIDARIVKI
ncbi:MAG: hypothetical protein A3K83_07155 [Omnitrophica WOR_2 bacterium RBG_13_44_8b]|nr:MAG: hypothetical protein A3K83_07155 [Omnitrophica WOR_2 bacterium RBG_13_44_8b]